MSAYYFEYDELNKIIAARFEAELDDKTFKEFYEAAPRYVERCDVRAGIVDFTGVTQFDVSSRTIREVAARSPLMADPAPRFVIAPLDHVFGMIRMFQSVSAKGRDMLQLVRSTENAYAALHVTAPRFVKLP